MIVITRLIVIYNAVGDDERKRNLPRLHLVYISLSFLPRRLFMHKNKKSIIKHFI